MCFVQRVEAIKNKMFCSSKYCFNKCSVDFLTSSSLFFFRLMLATINRLIFLPLFFVVFLHAECFRVFRNPPNSDMDYRIFNFNRA